MTKTLSIVLGIGYVALGFLGILDTSLVGTNGFFAADIAYSIVFMAIGAVLLFAALVRRESTRGIALTVGTLLALIALSGFLIVPDKGEMLGMLVNRADHWINLILGLVLAGTALMERETVTRTSALRQHFRHAMQ